MVEIRPIAPSKERDGIESLMIGHWQEVEANMTNDEPTPRWDIYEALENEKAVVAHAAYCDGEMIGYVVVLMAPHLHYGFMYGQHDVLYVAPGYRNSSIGLKLKKISEIECESRGAKYVFWHAKKGSAFAKICASQNRLEEEVYIKEF